MKRPHSDEEVAKQVLTTTITDVPDLAMLHAAVYLPYESLRTLRITNKTFYRLVERENMMFNFTDMRYLIFRTVHAILTENTVMFYNCQRAFCSTLPNLLNEVIDCLVALSIFVPNSQVKISGMSQLVLTALQHSTAAFTRELQQQRIKHAARLAASPSTTPQIQCLWTLGLEVTAITDDVMVLLGATGDWLQEIAYNVQTCLFYSTIRELALGAVVWVYSPTGARFKLNRFWPSTLWLYPPMGRSLVPGTRLSQTREFFSLPPEELEFSEVNSFYPETLSRLLDFFLQLDFPELAGAVLSVNMIFHPLVSEYTFLAAEKIIELFAAAGQLDELLDRLASLHLGSALPPWLEATHSFFSKPQICEFSGIQRVGTQADLFRAAAFSVPSPPPLVNGLVGNLMDQMRAIALLQRIYKVKTSYGQADAVRALASSPHDGLTRGILIPVMTDFNEQRLFSSWIPWRTLTDLPISAWMLCLRYKSVYTAPSFDLLNPASIAACICNNVSVCPQIHRTPGYTPSELVFRRERALADFANVVNREFDWSSTYSARAEEWTQYFTPALPMRMPSRKNLREKDQAVAIEMFNLTHSTNPFSWANDVTPEDAYATKAGKQAFVSDDGRMYDVQLLWTYTADLPVVGLATDALENTLKEPAWSDAHDDPLAPQTVLDILQNRKPEPREYLHHIQSIRSADLSFPILVKQERVGWSVVDGLHRLVKVILNGSFVVNVRVVSDEILKNALVPE
jgi:hypothetical protein